MSIDLLGLGMQLAGAVIGFVLYFSMTPGESGRGYFLFLGIMSLVGAAITYIRMRKNAGRIS